MANFINELKISKFDFFLNVDSLPLVWKKSGQLFVVVQVVLNVSAVRAMPFDLGVRVVSVIKETCGCNTNPSATN